MTKPRMKFADIFAQHSRIVVDEAGLDALEKIANSPRLARVFAAADDFTHPRDDIDNEMTRRARFLEDVCYSGERGKAIVTKLLSTHWALSYLTDNGGDHRANKANKHVKNILEQLSHEQQASILSAESALHACLEFDDDWSFGESLLEKMSDSARLTVSRQPRLQANFGRDFVQKLRTPRPATPAA